VSKETRAKNLYASTREEITRADAKATTLLGVASLLLGLLIAGAIAGDLDPRQLPVVAEGFFWAGSCCGIGSVVALCYSVFPRIDHDKTAWQVRYFGHVLRLKNREELSAALERNDDEFDQHVDQIYVLSDTVQKKYRGIQWAMWLMAAAVVVCVGSVLVDYWVN
jgi:hypothetical protein